MKTECYYLYKSYRLNHPATILFLTEKKQQLISIVNSLLKQRMKIILLSVIWIGFACVQVVASAEINAPDTRQFNTYPAYDVRNCPTQMQ